jgi:hypothetical protein
LKTIDYPFETKTLEKKNSILKRLKDYESPLKPNFYVRNYLLFVDEERAWEFLEEKFKSVYIY